MDQSDQPFVRGWPGRVAVGVWRGDPPQVFLAESDSVLSRVLAMELVARTSAADLEQSGSLQEIREALLEERWADALVSWMQATGETVDGYPDEIVWTEQLFDLEKASFEIRLATIFRDSEP